MSADIHILDCGTRLDLPAERVLQSALLAGFEKVVVVGITGSDDVIAASSTDLATTLLLLELAKKEVLE